MLFIGTLSSLGLTSGLVALALWLHGLRRPDILVAAAVIAGGLQLAAVIAWYLASTALPDR